MLFNKLIIAHLFIKMYVFKEIINLQQNRGYLFEKYLEVCITTTKLLEDSTKNIRNFKLWYLCIIKKSRNQNLNECTIK